MIYFYQPPEWDGKRSFVLMRGIYSNVTDIRRRVFTEVARMAYEGGDYSRIEELPYKIIPGEVETYRESIFLERAIVGELSLIHI